MTQYLIPHFQILLDSYPVLILFYMILAGVPGVARVNKVKKICNLVPPRHSICPPKHFICEIPPPLAPSSAPPLCQLPRLPLRCPLPISPSHFPHLHLPSPSPPSRCPPLHLPLPITPLPI